MAGRDELPALAEHLEDALWRVDSARLQPGPAEGLVVCGSGGAQRGARLAAAALDGRLTGPLMAFVGDRLPPAVGPDWSVLCASFTGEDAEALSCFEDAGRLGAGRLAVSTGGPLVDRAREEGVPVVGLPAIVDPDAAFAYYFVATAAAAALAGLAPGIEPEIEAAAAFLREYAELVAAPNGALVAEASATARLVLAAVVEESDGDA